MGRSKIFSWIHKLSAAVLDQLLISGSNFVVTLSLARWLGPAQYGAYAVMYSIFLLLGNCHQALLIEPMTVLQVSLYPESRSQYIGSVVWMHAAICGGLMVLAGGAAVILRLVEHSLLANAAFGMVVAIPCVLLLGTFRAAAYLDFRPGLAAKASATYCAALLLGLFGMYHFYRLSPMVTFSLMAFAALLAAGILILQVRPALAIGTRPGVAELWPRHWSYGSWILGSVVVQWVHTSVFLVITGAFLGLREAGALAALYSFMLPCTHFLNGISRLMLPHVAGMFSREGAHSVRRSVTLMAGGLFVLTGIYWLVLWVFSASLLMAVYGPDYAEFAHHVPWATACMVLGATAVPQEIGLRACRQPSAIMMTFCISAITTVVVGIPAVWQFGLQGVFATTSLTSLIHLIVVTIMFYRKTAHVPLENVTTAYA